MASDKPFGYAGKILRVDLTSEKISEEVLDESFLRKWVGGGWGAKYLYEEVPAGVRWDAVLLWRAALWAGRRWVVREPSASIQRDV